MSVSRSTFSLGAWAAGAALHIVDRHQVTGPGLVELLARVGIVSAAMLAKGRRYAIVGIFIFAAVVTPPDVISQVGLAIPMIALYEISIIAAKLAERARAQRHEILLQVPMEPFDYPDNDPGPHTLTTRATGSGASSRLSRRRPKRSLAMRSRAPLGCRCTSSQSLHTSTPA